MHRRRLPLTSTRCRVRVQPLSSFDGERHRNAERRGVRRRDQREGGRFRRSARLDRLNEDVGESDLR